MDRASCNYFDAQKAISFIMSGHVNPILLRAVLRIVLAIDLALFKMEQPMSCTLVAVIVSVKQLRNAYQTLSL